MAQGSRLKARGSILMAKKNLALGPPGCSQGGEMVRQSTKMNTPSPPNGNSEELKGAGGKGRSPSDN